jgi:pimeloyl-ACP methyl ester carboxylesterase
MLLGQAGPTPGAIETRSLRVKSGIIHYEAAGAGEPVVLLHGLSGSGRWWGRNVPFMAQRFRVYTVDLIGFGQSRGQRFALGEAAQVVLEWMDQLGIGQASLIGHSMGGYITIELAAHYADRVDKVVLVDALALPMNRSLLRTAARLVHSLRYMPFNFIPVLVGDAFMAGPGTIIRAGREILQADVRDELQSIAAPAMIVWGEKDPLLPLQLGKLMKMHMPQAELCVIPGAGHNPMWDRPDDFNWTVSGFLKSTQQSAVSHQQ